MIDHISIGVRDLERSTRLYEVALGAIDHVKLMVRPATVGFGKKYPEFWLNLRPDLLRDPDSGTHVCFRARSRGQVDTFYRAAVDAGARGDGAPAVRPEYHETYYAAFIRDFDGNLIELVTFLSASE